MEGGGFLRVELQEGATILLQGPRNTREETKVKLAPQRQAEEKARSSLAVILPRSSASTSPLFLSLFLSLFNPTCSKLIHKGLMSLHISISDGNLD
jgi:hypothetical protein